MSVLSLHTNVMSDYDHSNLVNNPPAITNYAFENMMKSLKYDDSAFKRDIFMKKFKETKRQESFISLTLAVTLAAIAAVGIVIRNKIKKACSKVKNFLK